jgi:Fe-S-cluster containining protein
LPRVFVKTTFDNIRFECQRCGSCCHHKRPQEFDDLIPQPKLKEFWEKSNLIYLTQQDIENISYKTNIKPTDFVDTIYEYDGQIVRVEESGKKIILDFPVMKSKEDTTCLFYDNGCTVYSVRPRACRLFPFRVEEETNPKGDIILCVGYNKTCPGIGKGKMADKRMLEKLVSDQFLQRSESIAAEVQRLAAEGKIQKSAEIYRSFPGRKL